MVNNKNKFKLNYVHHINTKQKYTFHQPSSNLSLFQKGVCSSGIKVFRNLLLSIKNLRDNLRQYKSALKNYLFAPSFYSVEEYFHVNREWYTKLNKLYCTSHNCMYVIVLLACSISKVLTCFGFTECK